MKRFFLLIVAFITIGLFGSCDNKNSFKDSPSEESDDMTDPEGTMIRNLNKYWSSISWYDAQFRFTSTYNIDCNRGQIVYLGTGRGLRDINTNKTPQNGWSDSAAAIVNGLYVYRQELAFPTSYRDDLVARYFPNFPPEEYDYGYLGIFIYAISSDVLGMKYCQFFLDKGWGWN